MGDQILGPEAVVLRPSCRAATIQAMHHDDAAFRALWSVIGTMTGAWRVYSTVGDPCSIAQSDVGGPRTFRPRSDIVALLS